MNVRTLKRVALWSACMAMMLHGFGCSLREIAAGMLSNFLTSGGASTVNSALGSGLGSLVSSLTGSST